MATPILPVWEFALHPCLRSVKMLRQPFTFEKLLAMVKNILPMTTDATAPIAPPNWQARSVPTGLLWSAALIWVKHPMSSAKVVGV
jgi:hypothetical protein